MGAATRGALAAIAAFVVAVYLLLMMVTGWAGSIISNEAQAYGNAPSALALAEIPPRYLRLYQQVGRRYDLDWAILAAIGSIESDHGRLDAPGVRSGTNHAGAAGPCQFLLSTWALDGIGNGGNVYDPADCIPAMARYLIKGGAPGDWRAALFSYNHAQWYVDDVLRKAAQYRGPPRAGGGGPGSGTVRQVLANRRLIFTPGQRADLQAGGISPWLLATLQWIGQRHTIIVTALRHDHSPGSNHEAGRAVDIGAVDGQVCGPFYGPGHPCGRLARELAAVRPAMRSNELIACFDPDSDPSTDPGGSWTIWAQGDHCDHVHAGRDG